MTNKEKRAKKIDRREWIKANRELNERGNKKPPVKKNKPTPKNPPTAAQLWKRKIEADKQILNIKHEEREYGPSDNQRVE
jgi:hypothetical protein